MRFSSEVVVTLRPSINDPQGLVVHDGLRQLGFTGVRSARVGKYVELEVEAADEASAHAVVTQMCEKLLRNPVIEDYRITVRPLGGAPSSGSPT
jgi:phosphoribosylformylglycinamidine synthase